MSARPTRQSAHVVLGIEAQSAEGDRFGPDELWDEAHQKELVDLLGKARQHARKEAKASRAVARREPRA